MIEKLKAGNEAWIEKINAEDPTFFSKNGCWAIT